MRAVLQINLEACDLNSVLLENAIEYSEETTNLKNKIRRYEPSLADEQEIKS